MQKRCTQTGQVMKLGQFAVNKAHLVFIQGFSDSSAGKESICNAGDLGLIPGLERSPRGRHGNPLQYLCLENLHGQRSLVCCSPWGCKESTTSTYSQGFPGVSAVKNLPAMQKVQEMQVQSLGQEDTLEECMATHSSILAGKFHGGRSLAGYSLWGCKESDMTEHALQVYKLIYCSDY